MACDAGFPRESLNSWVRTSVLGGRFTTKSTSLEKGKTGERGTTRKKIEETNSVRGLRKERFPSGKRENEVGTFRGTRPHMVDDLISS